MEAKYQSEMNKQKDIFQQHMLNQQELIEQEVLIIQHTAATTSDDSKECPQCAEIVKAKAKLCRFCNYKFE